MYASLLISSGLWSLCAAILFAWVMVAAKAKVIALSPLTEKRILQTHIDFIFMGILQIVLAQLFKETISGTVTCALILGSWLGPSLFILRIFMDINHPSYKAIALTGFSLATYSYFSLALQWKYTSDITVK